MANDFVPTAGMKLFYGAAGTADPATQLAGLRNIAGLPKNAVDEFEITTIDQMDGTEHDPFKQFAPDNIDPGTLNVKLALNETQLETLYGLGRTTYSWKILFKSGGKLVCDGWIKSIGPEAQDKQDVLVDVVIRWTGKPTFTKFVVV